MRVLYRLYRLRRLILVSLVPPVIAVCAVYLLKGPATVALAPLALFPVIHALRYPNAWSETLATSLTMATLIGFASSIGPDIGLAGLALRVFAISVVCLVIFVTLAASIPMLPLGGTPRQYTTRARRKSRLDPVTLKSAVTIFPGRVDARCVCGQPDADGVFPITIRHEMANPLGEGSNLFEVEMFGVILSDEPETHELITITEDSEDTSMTRWNFVEKKSGTMVELAEQSPPMTRDLYLGYWLTDYLADYLTDEIDRAEGREGRSNRFQGHDQLLFDLARFFAREPKDPTPAE